MFLAGLLATSALGFVQSPKLLVELNDEDLLRRAPELAGVHFDRNEELIETVLNPALDSLSQTFHDLADFSAAEQISELRLDNGGVRVHSQIERFRYVAAITQNPLEVRELRLSAKGDKAAKSAS